MERLPGAGAQKPLEAAAGLLQLWVRPFHAQPSSQPRALPVSQSPSGQGMQGAPAPAGVVGGLFCFVFYRLSLSAQTDAFLGFL